MAMEQHRSAAAAEDQAGDAFAHAYAGMRRMEELVASVDPQHAGFARQVTRELHDKALAEMLAAKRTLEAAEERVQSARRALDAAEHRVQGDSMECC